MKKHWRSCLRAGLLIVVGITLLPWTRHLVRGWVNNEHFYNGFPTSYWRQRLQEEIQQEKEARPSVAAHPSFVGRYVGVFWTTVSEALENGRKSAVPVLIELSRDKESQTRTRAFDILVQIGPNAEEALSAMIDAAESDDNSIRIKAIQVMGAIGPKSGPALMRLVRNRAHYDIDTIKQVIVCLRQTEIDCLPVAGELADLLHHRDPGIAMEAAEALGTLGSAAAKTAVKDLIKIIQYSEELGVVAGAMRALDRIDPRLSAVLDLLEHVAPEVDMLDLLNDFQPVGSSSEINPRFCGKRLPEDDAEIISTDSFFPKMKFVDISERMVGILLGDGNSYTFPVEQRGYDGQHECLDFSFDGGTYWYVRIPGHKEEELRAQVKKLGIPELKRLNYQKTDIYAYRWRHPPWGENVPYLLVEIRLTNAGARKEETIFDPDIRVLDTTPDYPVRIVDLISQLRKRYTIYLLSKISDEPTGVAPVGDVQRSHKRRYSTVMYVTWLQQPNNLRVRFLTEIGGQSSNKTEIGMSYEVSKQGTLVRMLRLSSPLVKRVPSTE